MFLLFLILLFLVSCAPPDPGSTLNSLERSWLVGERLRCGPQAISGEQLVLHEVLVSEDRSREQYLTVYNLRTRESERVLKLPDGVWPYVMPAIHDNRVVWAAVTDGSPDLLSSNYDVFVLDLKTREVEQITNEKHAQVEPRIYDDTVVWLDTRHMTTDEYPPYFDIYAYDLKTGQERRLTTTTSIREEFLSISGDLVVWSDDRYAAPVAGKKPYFTDGNSEIYIYDLADGTECRITDNPGADLYPVVDGDYIAWLRKPDPKKVNGDMYLFDRDSGQERRISSSGFVVQQPWPSISGNSVVWADARISQGNDAGDVGGILEDGTNVVFGAAEICAFDLETQIESVLVPSQKYRHTQVGVDKDKVYIEHDIWMRPVICGSYLVYEKETGVQGYLHALDLTK